MDVLSNLAASGRIAKADAVTVEEMVRGVKNEAVAQILEVAEGVLFKGMDLPKAIAEVADHRGIAGSTVRDKCTRRIGLSTGQFREFLRDREMLAGMLAERFPEQVAEIEKRLRCRT
jgi:hypothetical protein